MASRGQQLGQAAPRERAELLDVAAGLARHLAVGDHGFFDNGFLRSLAVIPFVPATKVPRFGLADPIPCQAPCNKQHDCAVSGKCLCIPGIVNVEGQGLNLKL